MSTSNMDLTPTSITDHDDEEDEVNEEHTPSSEASEEPSEEQRPQEAQAQTTSAPPERGGVEDNCESSSKEEVDPLAIFAEKKVNAPTVFQRIIENQNDDRHARRLYFLNQQLDLPEDDVFWQYVAVVDFYMEYFHSAVDSIEDLRKEKVSEAEHDLYQVKRDALMEFRETLNEYLERQSNELADNKERTLKELRDEFSKAANGMKKMHAEHKKSINRQMEHQLKEVHQSAKNTIEEVKTATEQFVQFAQRDLWQKQRTERTLKEKVLWWAIPGGVFTFGLVFFLGLILYVAHPAQLAQVFDSFLGTPWWFQG